MISKKKTYTILLLILSLSISISPIPFVRAAWLTGWDLRVKITIDSGDIDGALTDFPVLLYISSLSGINNEDITFIFDEVGANFLKIAVTESDGTTEYYVEVEKWDSGNEEAWLWVKIPSITHDADTEVYLYYDNDHADNNAHVGVTNSVVAENVWDGDFEAVFHMGDGVDNANIYDSTDNDRDGSKRAPNEPIQTVLGMMGNAQDFDAVNDYITFPQFNLNDFTVEAWAFPDVTNRLEVIISNNPPGATQIYLRITDSTKFYWQATDDEGDHLFGAPNHGVSADAWGYWVFQVSGITGTVDIDLVQRGLDTNAAYGALNFWTPFNIGRDPRGINIWDGYLDEIRISTIVRNDDWLKASFETGRDDLLDWSLEEVYAIPPTDPNLLFGAGFNASTPYVELHWNHNLVDVQFFEVQSSSVVMEQVLFGGYHVLLDTVNTDYNSLQGGYSWASIDANAIEIVSTDGLIKNLRVKLNGSPGASKKYTFTLMVNGNPTSLSVEISDAETSDSDMVNEIDVTGGNTISLQCDPDGLPTARYATWTSVFESDMVKESLILGHTINALDIISDEFSQVMCSYNNWADTEDNYRQVVPTSGTIKNLYVRLDEDPGTAPDAYRFTLRKGGISQDLTVTITADDIAGSDLVNSFDVVAGDILTFYAEPLNVPSATPNTAWGMTFVADINGESIVMGGSTSNLDNAQTEYYEFTSYSTHFWTADETIRYQLGQVCTLKNLYMKLSGEPGIGNKYDFTLRVAEADSNVLATVSGTDTTGNSGVLEDTVALDEYVSLQVVPDSTPTIADAYWGFVCYIAPKAEFGTWQYLGQSTTANYTDTQVVNGTARYYKVRACNQTGGEWYNSSWTDVNFETVYFIPGEDEITIVESDFPWIAIAIALSIIVLLVSWVYHGNK